MPVCACELSAAAVRPAAPLLTLQEQAEKLACAAQKTPLGDKVRTPATAAAAGAAGAGAGAAAAGDGAVGASPVLVFIPLLTARPRAVCRFVAAGGTGIRQGGQGTGLLKDPPQPRVCEFRK